MSPEAQRQAIAEFFGLGLDTGYCGNWPDYLHDLNAMHEAEELLSDIQIQSYLNRLADSTPAKLMNRYGYWPMIHATAAQRAEALLKTCGLWVD